jgi:hypothetical protein
MLLWRESKRAIAIPARLLEPAQKNLLLSFGQKDGAAVTPSR